MILASEMIGSDGSTLLPTIYIDGTSGAMAINAELGAFSAAINPIIYIASVYGGYGAPTHTSSYPTARDAAVLRFGTGITGQAATIVVPAPIDSMFLADQETVDPTACATLIAAIIAHGESPAGNPLIEYIGGYRKFLPGR